MDEQTATRPTLANPTLPMNDGIFSDGVTYQMATVVPNTTTGGFDAEPVGIAA